MLCVAFGTTAWLGLQWAVTPGGGPPVWPAAGIGLAGLLLGGPQLWPALFIGRLAAAYIGGSTHAWWVNLLLAAAATASPLASTLIIRRQGGLDPRLASLRDIVRLIIVGGGVGSVISALGGLALRGWSLPIERFAPTLGNWMLGYALGVLLVTPLVLALAHWREWRLTPSQSLHLAVCLGVIWMVADHVFLHPNSAPSVSWQLYPLLVWAALAFGVWGSSLALVVVGLVGTQAATQGLWPALDTDLSQRLMSAQEFLGASGLTTLILAAVADERRGKDQIATSERLLRLETEALETLNATAALVAADLDLESVAQKVSDAGAALTGAQIGAFFYRMRGGPQEDPLLFALSGAPREVFERFGLPTRTEIFEPTITGAQVVRSADVTKDPRYGKKPPHLGQPKGHPPVRSYLAIPVRSRSGEVLGGLLFGHADVGVFDERAERLVVGLAGQAAVALDNARLFQAAQSEIAERARGEEHQRLLINELNHRVKNTLATVQSIAAQTRRTANDPRASYQSFIDRLMALSRAHDVLTHQRWEGAELRAIAKGAVQPFEDPKTRRFRVHGPNVWLEPQTALALAMALHELATNASKYGALSVAGGQVDLQWSVRRRPMDGLELELVWREAGGPPVSSPVHRGFGSRLLERGLAGELNGQVSVDYRREGLVCRMLASLPAAEPTAEAAE